MKKYIKHHLPRISAWFVSLLLLLSGCTDESPIGNHLVKEGEKVKLRVYFDIPKQQTARTRSALDDDYINPNGLYILVFDTEDTLVEVDKATSVSTAENPLFFTNLTSTNQQRNVYILANATGIVDSKKETWTAGVTTLTDIKKDLLTDPLPTTNDIATAMPHPHPMIGYVSCSGISPSTSIGTSGAQIELTRTTVKVELINKTPEADNLLLLGANLANAPLQSYIFANPDQPETISRANYGSAAGANDLLSTGTDPTITLYCYEAAAQPDNNTFVLLKMRNKGTEGYHRINLTDASKKQLMLKRNYRYQVNINYIGTPGYATAEEAILKPAAADIQYDISVFDSHSHDMISNGEYYLGVSNSELVVYNEADLFNLTVTTLTTDAPASVPPATVTATSGNISIAAIDATPSPESGYKADVRINMPANVTDASLQIQVGNLTKTITIKRHSFVPEPGGVIEEFHRNEFVSGQIDSNVEGWLKLSTSVSASSEKFDELDNPAGGIIMHAAANIGFETRVAERMATVYLARSNDKGRVKVILKQKKLDIYRDKIQIEPYTYIGTFHRWHQTGERVIRIQPSVAGPTSQWTVVVVEGQDWIELSTSRSPDPGLGTDPYGAGDQSTWTDADIERDAQLHTDSVAVTGTGKQVYFRIGLKSPLPGGSAGDPRYGLVAIIHDKGNHFIFVRQGENPDFLMRRADEVTNDPAFNNPLGFSRDRTVPIAVYNLTDPSGTEGRVDRGKNGYDFVDYPSQGGYYFHGQATRAYSPTAAPGDFEGNPSYFFTPSWNANMETCPPGYRRFVDTPNHQYMGESEAKAADSEIRQSLWLYPRDRGDNQANFQNTIRGYLADGFYDRREMSIPPNTTYSSNNISGARSAVGTGTKTAFSGALFFNPYTHASVFFPEAGYMGSHSANGGPGVFRDKGEVGAYWSSSPGSARNGWSIQLGWGAASYPVIADNYLQDAGTGSSVRCVRENSSTNKR